MTPTNLQRTNRGLVSAFDPGVGRSSSLGRGVLVGRFVQVGDENNAIAISGGSGVQVRMGFDEDEDL